VTGLPHLITPQLIDDALATVHEYWSPRVVGEFNGQLVKVAKLKDTLVWHAHEREDELFLVVRGRLRIELEDRVVELEEGRFTTVPRGVRHNPVADSECWIVLIEPASTAHTGDEVVPQTKSLEDQLRG